MLCVCVQASSSSARAVGACPGIAPASPGGASSKRVGRIALTFLGCTSPTLAVYQVLHVTQP